MVLIHFVITKGKHAIRINKRLFTVLLEDGYCMYVTVSCDSCFVTLKICEEGRISKVQCNLEGQTCSIAKNKKPPKKNLSPSVDNNYQCEKAKHLLPLSVGVFGRPPAIA